jgi:hypothetical protein
MPRFRKGTTDHDNDGRMGGSMKGSTMAKAPAKKAPAKRATARKATKAPTPEAVAMATVPDPQTGMASARVDEAPSPKAVKASQKAALDAQFGDADEKAREAIQDATLSRAVRGW